MKIVLILTVFCCCYSLGASQVYSCPPLEEDTAGICSEDCTSNDDCEGPLMCCSNGCGHTCVTPTTIPYHAPPYDCPTPSDDIVGICAEECGNDTLCDEGQQCCSNGCGHTCVSLCNLIQVRVTNQTLVGAYVPQCEEDGSFSTIQCHGSTGFCWCVSEVTGEPMSGLIRGQQPQCSCAYNGETHRVGETFSAADDYNTCSCTVDGRVLCTTDTPPQPDNVFYSCPAVREEEDAGICVAECTVDSECTSDTKCCYTGCGYSCVTPEIIPYVPIPTLDTCPPSNEVPCALSGGSCADSDSDNSDSDNSDSDSSNEFACNEETSMCCENDCASSVCLYRTGVTPCYAARKIARENNETMATVLGKYQPQCDFDGHFREIQCHEHFCWCVEMHSGIPKSDYVAFENLDSLYCSKCVYEGHKYSHLESFPAEDGCNTCSCIAGEVSCTEVGCVDPGDDDLLWNWWHSILIGCVIAVILLALIVLALLVGVIVTIKKNKFRHRRLKEATSVHFESDMDAVYFKQGQDLNTVELKVPVEDVDSERDPAKA